MMKLILALVAGLGFFPLLMDGSITDPNIYNQVSQRVNVITAHGTGDGAYLQFLEPGDQVDLAYDDEIRSMLVIRKEIVSEEEYTFKLRMLIESGRFAVVTCVYGGVLFIYLDDFKR